MVPYRSVSKKFVATEAVTREVTYLFDLQDITRDDIRSFDFL